MAATAPGPLDVLRRVRRPTTLPRPGERCELCATEVAEDHRHLVDVESRRLLCACRACALLFDGAGAGGGHFRAVPRDVRSLPEGVPAEGDWEALQIPVGVAFLFTSSATGQAAAFYPSPAGATESLLPLGAFEEIAAAEPALAGLQPDVEALLVRRTAAGSECYVVPIDVCYALVGIIRQSWRGFDGGSEAHARIDELFAGVRTRARPAVRG